MGKGGKKINTADFEKLLREEQIAQKKNLSGVRGRASRTGKKPWRTPVDFLDSKGRKAYKKAGLVYSYFLEEGKKFMDVLFNDFQKIEDPEAARTTFLSLAKENSDAKMADHWNISLHHLKHIRKMLGITKDKKGNIIQLSDKFTWPIVPLVPNTKTIMAEKVVPRSKPAFSLVFRGEYDTEAVLGRIDAIRAFLAAGPQNKFRLLIEVEEVEAG